MNYRYKRDTELSSGKSSKLSDFLRERKGDITEQIIMKCCIS